MRGHLAREGIEEPGLRLRRRAEDRRAGDLAALRGRRARARRHARQRRGRRGRHAQPAHDPGHPAAHRGRAAAARGARRGLHVAAGLRRAQRAPRRAGPLHVHEPAQLGGGDDPPARPGARRRAPAVDVVLRRSARSRACASPATGRALEWLRDHGFRVNGDVKRLEGEDEVVAQCLALAGAARRAGLRDRRRGGQGRRPRAAAPARRRRARPALGGGVEVPADHRRDAAARDPVERGQVRRPAPVRRARARARERRHGQARHAAQRGGPRPQGHPPGRRRDRAARRATSSPRCSRPPRTPSSAPTARRRRGPPARCPVCDTPTVKPEGSVFTKCPNRDCPDRRWQLLKHFVSGGAMDVDGLGEKQVALLQAAGLVRTPADFFRAAQGGPARARGRRRGVGHEPPGGDRALARAAVRDRAVRHRDRGRRLRHGPQPRPAVPLDRRAAGRHAGADRRDARDRAQGGGAHPRASCRTRRCAR